MAVGHEFVWDGQIFKVTEIIADRIVASSRGWSAVFTKQQLSRS